ncbi:MAG TPA: caspase family protein, partial [Bradyrhizobium sp.]|nr:caspase family protein [Bradyrhizobium sp.]
ESKASENVADNKAVDQVAAGPPAAGKTQPTNVAALSDGPAPADIAKSMQIELRRVGCLTAAADGEWNSASQRSLALFNRHAGTRLNVKLASTDALDAIKLKPSRVCPLVCEHGFKPDGERCSRIVCAEGSFLNDDNECEKRRGKKPVATRDRDQERAAPLRPQAKQVIVGRSHAPTSASTARPLTGQEREEGCNSYGAIMSGKCP